MSSPLSKEKFRRPTLGLIDLIKRNAGGAIRDRKEYGKFMYRALVIAVDTYGGRLENPEGKIQAAADSDPEEGKLIEEVIKDGEKELARYTVEPNYGPRNPKNSVRARIISNEADKFADDDHLRTYWPLFPGFGTSVSAGELVYVIFEDEEMRHGLWVGKVPNDLPDDNPNLILISKALREKSNSKNSLFETLNPNDADNKQNTINVDGRNRLSPNRLTKIFIDP